MDRGDYEGYPSNRPRILIIMFMFMFPTQRTAIEIDIAEIVGRGITWARRVNILFRISNFFGYIRVPQMASLIGSAHPLCFRLSTSRCKHRTNREKFDPGASIHIATHQFSCTLNVQVKGTKM